MTAARLHHLISHGTASRRSSSCRELKVHCPARSGCSGGIAEFTHAIVSSLLSGRALPTLQIFVVDVFLRLRYVELLHLRTSARIRLDPAQSRDVHCVLVNLHVGCPRESERERGRVFVSSGPKTQRIYIISLAGTRAPSTVGRVRIPSLPNRLFHVLDQPERLGAQHTRTGR